MLDAVFALNNKLGTRLIKLARDDHREPPAGDWFTPFRIAAAPEASQDPAVPIHVVVTGNEVTNLHGTGPLVMRITNGWQNVFSIRSRNEWGGQAYGDWQVCLSPGGQTRSQFFHNVLHVLRNRNVRTVLCVPFNADEFYTSIAIHECFGAKLCAYIMDDQNVAVQKIPDALMREFLERCSVRLATHPELQTAYERKYDLPFHVLPAIVPSRLVRTGAAPTPPPSSETRKGVLIGSFWDQTWFDRLCAALCHSGWQIDWFGNNKSPWLDLSPERLVRAGITAHGMVPEEQLVEKLTQYPFVIVPAAALDGTEGNHGVARLSLPGRILFAVASAHLPVLIVGSSRTCAARFVTHFGLGEVAPYDSSAVCAAMERLSAPKAQARMRLAAARIAPALSDFGVSEWLSRSIELGYPADDRFQEMFSGYDARIDFEPTAARALGAML